MSLTVPGHTPSQEKIARLLSGVEGVPAGEARKMVNRAAAVGAKLDLELEELREWKADIEESWQRIMKEQCPSDERHCTCVPFLRMEIAKLREVIKYTLDIDRRQNGVVEYPYDDCWKKMREALSAQGEHLSSTERGESGYGSTGK